MKRNQTFRFMLPALAALAWPVQTIRADVFNDIAFGLGYAGFDISGNHNPLSGGIDFLVTNTFVGNELDFGPSDLTLQGPISLAISTGGREFSELEFSLRTAVNASSQAVPLSYIFNYDTGAQTANVTGNLFLDANVKINSFGFYDLEMRYSSRQTVDSDGRILEDAQTFDSDLGPINVRGNIFADALAIITEPLFAAAGAENPFERFSASANLKALLDAQTQAATEALAAGGVASDAQIARLANNTVLNQVLGGSLSNVLPPGISLDAFSRANARVVPEPTVMLLMLLGLPLVVREGFRRKNRR